MNLNELLITELKRESESTRKLLNCVPEEKNDWKPHEKSFTLARMAAHVAELPHWLERILNADEFDFLTNTYKGASFATHKELMEFFEMKLTAGLAALEHTTNEQLQQKWVIRRGDMIISKGTRYESLRSWMMNHQIHHRGQLSVYLRLLDVPIPGMYGPSADDMIARQKAAEAAAVSAKSN